MHANLLFKLIPKIPNPFGRMLILITQPVGAKVYHVKQTSTTYQISQVINVYLLNVHMANDLGNPLGGAGRSKYGSCNIWVLAKTGQKSRSKNSKWITNLTLICSDYLLFLVIQQLTGSESRSRHVDSFLIKVR